MDGRDTVLSDIALQVDSLSKFFRVARVRGSHDPRREPLSWRRDRFWALRGVSFSLGHGETLGIIGPNGSGKSTLLKILSGVMTPDVGAFRAHGRIGALLELGAGFHPELSGIDNVYLNGALLGLNTRDVDRLLPEIIAFAELERFMDMPVKHYSSGMAARLGFAVATQLEPEILLLDETFAAGDARFQIKAFDHMSMMRGRGRTMIVVSHNFDMMIQLVDRVVWLENGAVRRDGPARDVIAEYRHTRSDLERAGITHSVLGVDSIFEDTDPDRAVRIEAVRWRAEEKCETREADCGLKEDGETEVGIEMGRHLIAELELAHPGAHPEEVAVETAWARPGGQILAQSRTVVRLEPGAATRRAVRLGPWNLIEGLWHGALALAPAGEAGRPRHFLYYDRAPGRVIARTLTPNTMELTALITEIGNRWTVGEKKSEE